MSDEETTWIDIYEAAGAKISEDRLSAQIGGEFQAKPFEIILTVALSGYEVGDGPDKAILGVILHDEFTVEQTHGGGIFRNYEFNESLEIPISQVRILKKE